MKIQNKTVFPLMIVFVTIVLLSVPPAFAENANVSVPQGTSVPGCETTNECFMPMR